MPAGLLHLYPLLLTLQLAWGSHLSPAQSTGMPDTQDGVEALLKLKDLPRAPGGNPRKKAPQFMLDFFKAVSDTEGTTRSQKDVLQGTIVRSFVDKGPVREKFHFFNLSSIGREETMIKAEFRWFRKKHKIRFGKFHSPHFYKVDLYEVMDGGMKPWRGNLITSRLVPLYIQGWEVFNITQMVSKWILKNEENRGILVVATFPYGDLEESKQADGLTDTNAYLVIFSDDGRIGANQSDLEAAAAPGPQHTLTRRRRAPSGFSPRARSCHRVPLFVDFDEIGWSGWIISPRGYNAYHCTGPCPFPLGVGLRATNHATVRSIMHALKLSSGEVGAPCCVPDRLQSISLLYFDDEENVVLKQYDDMLALSCGCH